MNEEDAEGAPCGDACEAIGGCENRCESKLGHDGMHRCAEHA